MSIQYDIDSVKSDMKYKVDKADLKDFRELVEKRYATLDECKAVDLRFNDFATLIDLSQLEHKLDEFKAQTYETYIPENDADSRIQELKADIYKNFPHKDDVKNSFGSIERKLPLIVNEISSLKAGLSDAGKEFKAIYNQFDVYKGQLNTKSEIVELHKVAKQFSQYAKRKELDELYEKVNPVVKTAEEVTLTAKNDISQLREIVGRFDEVVNEKASKFNLNNVEEQIKKFPLKTELEQVINELKENFIPIEEKVADVEAKMDTYKK